MAANSVNRETVRDALYAVLNTALVGTGKPADKAFGYLAGELGTPVSAVVVTSAGSERERTDPGQQTFDVWFYYDVYTYVLYNDGGAWTEAEGEDKRDLIEKTIADVVQDNTTNAAWDDLQYAGRTTATEVEIEGGITYFVERIPLRVRVFQG